MSHVDNVILTTSVIDASRIEVVNAKFSSGGKFVACKYSAGTKALETNIYPGAFNYLNLDDLIFAIESVTWASPETVQLFIQGQDEDRFRDVPLWQSRTVDGTVAGSRELGTATLRIQEAK